MAIHSIDNERCVGCKKCMEACPMDVFQWDEGQGKLTIANRPDCITCYNCELNCFVKALYVASGRAKPVVFPWSFPGEKHEEAKNYGA